MYLFPRLIGIGIYVSILMLINTIMRRGIRTAKASLNVYWVIVGIMGFFFVPPPSFDLTRLIERMHYYSSMSFAELVSAFSGTLTPGERLYYWIIGRFHNDRLLSCISGLISFGFCFSLLKDHAEKERSTAKELAVALMLFMSRGAIMMAISNIRAFMSLSIIAWCVYQEIINRKSAIKHLPLYIWACSMHAMGYACVIIYVFWRSFDREQNIAKKIVKMLGGVCLFVASTIFLEEYWLMLLKKAFRYFEKRQDGTAYWYLWEAVLCGMAIVTTIFLLNKIMHLKKSSNCVKEAEYESFGRFMGFIVIVDVVAMFFEFNFFMRMGYFLTILDIPLSLYTLRLARQDGKQAKVINQIYFIFAAILALACTRGYLCSLKFFE